MASNQRHAGDFARIMIVTEDLIDAGLIKSALQSQLKSLEFIVSSFEMADPDFILMRPCFKDQDGPDLILLDMGDTIKDLAELITKIRQLNKFRVTCIVALTPQEIGGMPGVDLTIRKDEFESRVTEVTQLIVDSWLGTNS